MQQNGTYDVKLGKSFFDNDHAPYMTMRCDFMPASVDRSKPGSIKVNDGKEVVVNLLNIASTGSETTVFRGSARPVQKECILIFNKKTQELTLERISHTVQLKKTREERKMESVLPASEPNNETTSRSSPPKRKPCDSEHSNSTLQTSQITQKKTHLRTLSSSSSDSSTSNGSAMDDESSSDANSGSDSEDSISSLSSLSSGNGKSLKKSNQTPKSGTKVDGANHIRSNAAHRKLIEHDLKLSDSESD